MNTSDYLNLVIDLILSAVIFGYGVMVGLVWSSTQPDKPRIKKRDDDDTTPPPTATA